MQSPRRWKTENDTSNPAGPKPTAQSPGRATPSAFWAADSWGRMLALAAADMGLDVHIFTPETDSPASRVAKKTWVAAWDDEAALKEFAASIAVATIEFENVPVAATDLIERQGTPMRPGGRTLARAQDRLAEKTFFREIGIEPAPFERIDGPEDIQPALDRLGGNGVLKSRFSGYDGKGQVRLKDKAFRRRRGPMSGPSLPSLKRGLRMTAKSR